MSDQNKDDDEQAEIEQAPTDRAPDADAAPLTDDPPQADQDAIGVSLDTIIDEGAEVVPAPQDPVPTLQMAPGGRPMTPREIYEHHVKAHLETAMAVCQRAGLGYVLLVDATDHSDPKAEPFVANAVAFGPHTASLVQMAAMTVNPPRGISVGLMSTASWIQSNGGKYGKKPS